MKFSEEEVQNWNCEACGEALVMREIEFSYMKGSFHVELPACPKCALVLITEELAMGKMAEAEKALEDK
ncbi:MAG: DVU_1557 family redox protein [Pedobacter sp.]